MADCETWSRAPAPVNEPVSAIAWTISSCRRSMAGHDLRQWSARSEIKRSYRNHLYYLWLLGRRSPGADLEGAFHVLALRVRGQVAVNRVRAFGIRPEFEGDGLPGGGPLRDSVGPVDREAVGDVPSRKGD